MAVSRESAPAGWTRQPGAVSLAVRQRLSPKIKTALGFSIAANLLLLVSPLYMLQIYDRVLTSGSIDTLIWLTVIAVFLLLIYAAADRGRRAALAAAGGELDETLGRWIFRKYENGAPSREASLSADLNRLSRVQQLFLGNVLTPAFDLPFAPLFLLVLFLVHPVLGLIGVVGGGLVFALALIADRASRDASSASNEKSLLATSFAAALDRQRIVIAGMGMGANIRDRYAKIQRAAREDAVTATLAESRYSSLIKSARQALQVIILGAGAALTLAQAVSPGAIVAGSIILARALGPIDQIVGAWRAIARGREAWAALQSDLAPYTQETPFTPAPAPEATLIADRLAAAPPGASRALIRPFNLRVDKGAFVALTGPIGSGKTTLLNTLAGAWAPHEGHVLLGGRDLNKWAPEDRGRFVGYVPQRVEMLPGTIKENIAQFGDASDAEIFAAIEAAGVASIVNALPKALDTPVDAFGGALSAGQCQMVGLARALLRRPVLLLLDEPTANLDPHSALALIASLRAIANAGAIVFAATHDARLIQATDSVLSLNQGDIERLTPEELLNRFRTAQLKLAASNGVRS